MRELLGWQSRAFRYWKTLAVVIESGAIYSSALIIEITLYFLNTNAFYIIYDPIAQLTVRMLCPILILLQLMAISPGNRSNHDYCDHLPGLDECRHELGVKQF